VIRNGVGVVTGSGPLKLDKGHVFRSCIMPVLKQAVVLKDEEQESIPNSTHINQRSMRSLIQRFVELLNGSLAQSHHQDEEMA